MSTWTVMVYMGADNLPTEKDLSKAARDDLAEMQTVGSNDQLTILVQVDDKTVGVPRRYRVLKDSLELHRFEGDTKQIDMASARVLESFLTWGFGYKADHFLLVLWGHSYRYAFGFDASADGDSLDFTMLSGILDRCKRRSGRNLDVLGFDACGVSAIEVAYQFRDSVDYLVASEVGVPFMGWPYATILERAAKDGPSPEALSKGIVDDYLASTGTQSLMLAALNLAEHQRVLDAMIRFSASLAVAVADFNERQIIATAFDLALITRSEPLVDLQKLCDLLRTHTRDKDVMASAGAIRHILSSAGNFVIAMDRRGQGTEGLGGVSAYAPHVTTASERRITDKRYSNLALSRRTLWPGVVGFLNVAT